MKNSNALRESIKRSLQNEEKKLQISLVLPSETLKSLDIIGENFKGLTGGKIFSRNQLMEMALEGFIKEAAVILLENGINIEEFLLNQDMEEEEEETISEIEQGMVAIFPGRTEGFEQVFLQEHQWYSIRIAKQRLDKIEYVACYRTAPYSEITHYAKVKDIVEHEGTSKYKIIFEGAPIPLKKPIKRGNHTGFQSTKYTTFEKLNNAREIVEL